MLLFIGIALGLNISGLANYQVYAYEAVVFLWWAPLLGTALFGIGTFIRLSGANRDLSGCYWCCISPCWGQAFGENYFNSYIGAFIGANAHGAQLGVDCALTRRTAGHRLQTLAFWFLVPGARGLLSVTSILSEDLQSAAMALVRW